MTIGERIKLRRKELGLTQTELAERMGLTSKTTICKAETKDFNPTMDRVKEFAKALETTPGYLLGWTEIKEIGNSFSLLKEQLEEKPKETIDTYMFNNNQNVINMSENVNNALRLYKLYENADPRIKAAVESLLKGPQ